MPGKSNTTSLVTIRLSNATIEILRRRAAQTRYEGIGSYLRARIEYDTHRKHRRKENAHENTW